MARTVYPYTDEYNEFWRKWPGRWQPETDRYKKVGKYEAFLEWRELSETDRKNIIKIVSKVKAKGTQYLPDAHRWLKRRMWDDY